LRAAVGTTPIRMSMMSPMPFWPSFEPCAKLTPVHVRIRIPRIHHGGGPVLLGSEYSSGFRATNLRVRRATPKQKPIRGDSSSEIRP
jgi:hypothetical protein